MKNVDFPAILQEGHMGQKDLTGKNFILYPDVYADTLNALAYAGREVVHAKDLLPAPTESFYYVEQGKLTDQFSDAAMHEMRDGMVHVLYIVENEVQAKPKTILRKVGYEGALYRCQYDSSRTYPIVSLILYWGAASWKQPVSFKELFRETDLDKGTWKYITNTKLCVYEMAHLSKQVRNRFRSDMRIVVDYLAERNDYKPSTQKIAHPEALLLMLKALTGDKRYLKILKALTEEEKKGEVSMCELLDKYENRGIERGRKQGIRQGIQQGESRFAMLSENLLNAGRIDDLRKASASRRYRNQLYKEFGMV